MIRLIRPLHYLVLKNIKKSGFARVLDAFFFAFFVFAALPVHTYAATANSTITTRIPGSGLVGWWTFDGKDMVNGVAQDRSGQANDGNLLNIASTTFYTGGKIGQAGNFDGVDDRVNIPTNPYNFNNANSPSFTISAWVKTSGCGALNCQIFANTPGGGGTGGYTLALTSSLSPSFTLRSSGAGQVLIGGSSATANAWSHVVITYSASSTMSIYLNGVSVGSVAIANGVIPNSGTTLGNTSIGRNPNTNNIFPGLIDDVRVYNRALSATEVTALYNSSQSSANTSSVNARVNPAAGGLVGYWTMDGKDTNWAAGTMTDRSGNGNIAQLVSMSTSTSPAIGKVGQALNFDGVNNYASIPSYTVLNPGTGNFSYSSWVKSTNTATTQYILSQRLDGNNNINFSFSSKPSLLINLGGVGVININANTNTLVPVNNWYHIVVVVDRNNAANCKIYINGIDQTHDAITNSSSINFAATYRLGVNGFGTGNFMSGSLDDVRVYNRALSATEVVGLYKSSALGAASNVTPAASRLSSGLVGWWTFDGKDTNWTNGTVADRSGSGNTGNIVNMSTSTTPAIGKLGQAFNFDGVDDYVKRSSDIISTNPLTITAWIKPTASALAGGVSYIVSNGNATTFRLASSNRLAFSSDNAHTIVSATNALAGLADKWTFISVTRDASGTANIYINGIPSGTINQDSGTPISGTDFEIGARLGGTFFGGSIDDVRIYNRALSATEISQLYNLGR